MLCRGTDSIALASTMHYFLGTITGQDEDERPVLNLLRRAVRPGDTVLDIGANLGFYSFFLAPLCGKTGAVHAFEANPILIPHLRHSAALNEAIANITVNPVAVGSETNKELRLYDPERIGGSSLHRLPWLDSSKSVIVPMTTIDEYRRTQGISRIDVVKIDIEGAELDAFRGMDESFTVCPPKLIVCELALMIAPGQDQRPPPASIRGVYAAQIMEFLHSRNYEPHYIEADGEVGLRVDAGELVPMQQNLINVAFVHRTLRQARPDLFRA